MPPLHGCVFYPLLKISLGNPYLKILDLAKLFVVDAPYERVNINLLPKFLGNDHRLKREQTEIGTKERSGFSFAGAALIRPCIPASILNPIKLCSRMGGMGLVLDGNSKHVKHVLRNLVI